MSDPGIGNQPSNQLKRLLPKNQEAIIDECLMQYLELKGMKDIKSRFKDKLGVSTNPKYILHSQYAI